MTETEHPCDSCIVITDELDPNEHCDGCTNEMQLMDYVPPDMRDRTGFYYPKEREADG